MNSKKINLGIWLSLLLLGFAALGFKIHSGLPIESDLLKLLPKPPYSADQLEARDKFIEKNSLRVSFVIGHQDKGQVQVVAKRWMEDCEKSGQFEKVWSGLKENEMANLGKELFPQREKILNSLPDTVEELLQQSWLASMGAFASPGAVLEDPLALFSLFWQQQGGVVDGAIQLEGEFFMMENQGYFYIPIFAKLKEEPLRPSGLINFHTWFPEMAKKLKEGWPEAKLDTGGLTFFVHQESSRIKNEMNLIGASATIAALVWILFFFRRGKPLGLILICLGFSVLWAITSVAWIFGEVHLVTLTFGFSLIGISVDYGLHYLLHSKEGVSPREVIKEILPSLSLGLLTTTIGFSSLLWSPFPGLQQIALFSSVGLLGAYLSILLLAPSFYFNAKAHSLKHIYLLDLGRFITGKFRFITWLGVLLLFPVVYMSTYTDDVSKLQGDVSALLAKEEKLYRLLGGEGQAQVLIAQANSMEELLDKLAELRVGLQPALESGQIFQCYSLDTWLQSSAQQLRNQKKLTALLLGESEKVNRYFDQIGLPSSFQINFWERIKTPTPVLPVSESKLSQLPTEIQNFWLGQTGGVWSASMILQCSKELNLKSLVLPKGVFVLRQKEDLTESIKTFRERLMPLMGLAFILVLILTISIAGFRRGLAIVVAPLFSSLCTLFLLSYAELNLFSLLAAIIVFCLSIDYSIFLNLSRNIEICRRAVLLSAVTSVLAFLPLGLSSSPVLKQLGIGIGFGVLVGAWSAISSCWPVSSDT